MKKYIISFIILLAIVPTVAYAISNINDNKKGEIYSIDTVSGDVSGNEMEINEFIKTTEKGKKATLQVSNTIKDIGDSDNIGFNDSFAEEYEIYFDGKYYVITKGKKEDKYLYCYIASGTWPNSSQQGTEYILANEKYTFNQLCESYLSSNSNNHLEYKSICFI